MSGHAMLAGMTKTPELELDESEAGKLAAAFSVVSSFYNMPVSPVVMAWIALGMVAGEVYGPRIVAVGVRRSEERAARKAAPKPSNPTGAQVRPEDFMRVPDQPQAAQHQDAPVDESIYDGGQPREWMNGGAPGFQAFDIPGKFPN